jgi:hypothetical protein
VTRLRLTSFAALQQKQAGILRPFVDSPEAAAIFFAPHKKDGNAQAEQPAAESRD